MTADDVSPGEVMPEEVEYVMHGWLSDISAECDFGPEWHSVEALAKAIDSPEPESMPDMQALHRQLGPNPSMNSVFVAISGGKPHGGIAISLLGKLGGPEAFDVVVQHVDDPMGYRGTAIKALGRIGDARAVPYVIPALDDQGREVAAFFHYWQGVDQPPFPGLFAAYESWMQTSMPASYPNGASAAHALGLLRDARAVPRLMELLQDDECDFRDVVADALGHIGDPSALALLKEMAGQGRVLPWTRRAALNIEARQKAVPQLLSDLESQDSEVRGYAVVRLGEIGDETAIPALERLSHDRTAFKTNAGIPSRICAIHYLAAQAIEQIRARRQPESADQGTPPAHAGQR